MIKKPLWLVISLCLFLTGCWDQRELSHISVVTGMAIDVGDNAPYKFTIEAINAAELNEQTAGGYSPTVVYTLEGKTIAELAQKMNVGVSRSLIYSHTKTLVISKEVAEKGMLEFLDFLERNREIRDDFNFLVAKEGKAADVLKILYTIQKSSTLKLKVQLETAAEMWGSDPDVRLDDFLSALLSPGRQPVLAMVKIQGDPKKGESVNNMMKASPEALVVLDSMALFRDEKLEGVLSLEDIRNYMWTQDKVRRTVITVPCDNKLNFAIRVKNSETKLKGQIINGKPHIQVDVQLESYVATNQCKQTLDSKEIYHKFEDLAAKNLEEQISGTIQKVQKKYGIDIFGFGEVVNRQDHQHFKEIQDHWDEVFSTAEIDVNARVNISRAGLHTKGVKPEQ